MPSFLAPTFTRILTPTRTLIPILVAWQSGTGHSTLTIQFLNVWNIFVSLVQILVLIGNFQVVLVQVRWRGMAVARVE